MGLSSWFLALKEAGDVAKLYIKNVSRPPLDDTRDTYVSFHLW
jgi:hypothetical protein